MKNKLDRIKELFIEYGCNPEDENATKLAEETIEIAQEPETVNYWDGKVALICSYCKGYNSFPSVEELKTHIQKVHNRPLCECGAHKENYQEMMHTPCCEEQRK